MLTQAQQMPQSWYKSQAAFDKSEYSVSLQYIDSCILKSEKNPIFWNRRGEILYNQGNYNDAIVSLKKAEKYKKGLSSYNLAKSCCKLGDTASCFAWLLSHLESTPKTKESIILLDPAFEIISSTKRWENIWTKEWYSSYEKLVSEVEYLMSKSQWEEAVDILNQRLKGGRKQHILLALRAKVYYELGSYRLSVDDYTSALTKSKKNSEYFAGRASSWYALGRFGNAIGDLNKAINLSGGNPKYFRQRAEAFFANKNYDKAFEDILYYMDFYPADVESSFLLSKIAIESGHYVDALMHLGKLIKTNPQEPSYYYYRGITYLKTQSYQFAEMDLNIAIKFSYHLSDAYYFRGLARVNQSKKEDACSDWDNALKNGNFQSQEMLFKYCDRGSIIKKR